MQLPWFGQVYVTSSLCPAKQQNDDMKISFHTFERKASTAQRFFFFKVAKKKLFILKYYFTIPHIKAQLCVQGQTCENREWKIGF